MNNDESVEKEIETYEAKNGPLPAHNRGTLRKMLERDNAWWDKEEGRVLKDSNRYADDN